MERRPPVISFSKVVFVERRGWRQVCRVFLCFLKSVLENKASLLMIDLRLRPF